MKKRSCSSSYTQLMQNSLKWWKYRLQRAIAKRRKSASITCSIDRIFGGMGVGDSECNVRMLQWSIEGRGERYNDTKRGMRREDFRFSS